jgi:DNA repair protein RadD
MGVGLFTLKPRQVDLLTSLKQAVSSGAMRPVLQASTGLGKTVIAAHIVAGALRKGKRVAFVVPRLTLIRQTFERFIENGIGAELIGVIQGQHEWRRPHAPVQICSIDTLARRGFPIADVVVIDECHEVKAAMRTWVESAPETLFIGLTATPWSKGMGDVYDRLVNPVSMQTLIDEGYLSKLRVFASAHPDLTGVRTVAGDYREDDLSAVMSSKTITADVVSNWLENGERRQTILFAVDRAHAAHCCEEFVAAGIAAEYIDGNTPDEERKDMFRRYRNGDTLILCSVGVLTLGFDAPCQCVIFARPTKSEILWVQAIGRGLRVEDGKTDCLVFDHTDTGLRLGLPPQIHHERLRTAASDAAEKASKKDAAEERVSLPRECVECHALIPPKTRVCPNCGAVPKRRDTVQVREGELVELGADQQGSPRTAKKGPARERIAAQGRQAVLSQLIAMQGKKKDGWVFWKFKSLFGVAPGPDLRRTPATPTPEVQMWVHSENIRWAKSQGANTSFRVAAE